MGSIVVKGKTRDEVRQRADDIIDDIEKQCKSDYSLDVWKNFNGHWSARLTIEFHTENYPSHYPEKTKSPVTPT